jgi:hypothetical protein
MGTPRAVKKQAEKSEKLLKEIENPNPDGEAKPEQNPEEPDLKALVGEQPAGDKPPASADGEKGGETDPPKKDAEDWEHKYQVLKGKHDNEVPLLHTRLREAGERVKSLESEIQSLRTELEDAKKAKTEEKKPTVDELLGEADEFPPEVVAVLRQNEMENAELRNELKKLSEQLVTKPATEEQNTGDSSLDLFFVEVDRLCPDWEKVNTDPRFIEWLNSTFEPKTGTTKQEALKRARESLNHFAAAAYFNEWKDLVAEASPPSTDGEQEPGLSGGGGNPSPAPEKPTYTATWIKKFYTDAANKRSTYSPEEFARIDKDIQAAQMDGRIKPG